MPQYRKAFDIGTYTGNAGQYRVGIPTIRNVGPTGTQIAGSLRFRQENNAYLYRTSGTPTNQQKMTFSFWLKKSSAAATRNILFTNDSGGAYGYFEIYSDNSLTCGDYGSGGYSSTFKFVDNSRWFHIVVAFDTTQASASNRMIVYVDGVRDGGSYAGLTQNGNLYLNASGYTSQIGSFTRIGVYSGIYLSQFYLIDGQQLTPSSFGELNSDGIWVPKAYSGTYGNNGCYLPMNSSTNFKNDQSGNGNNWTPSVFNVTTANASYDLVTDSPTDYLSGSMSTANNAGNYATLNPYSAAAAISLSGGNLTVSSSSGSTQQRISTIVLSSGKWYFEVNMTSVGAGAGDSLIGISEVVNNSSYTSNYPGQSSTSYAAYCYVSNVYIQKYNNASATNTNVTAPVTGDVMAIAFDLDAGKMWIAKNNTWTDSGNPSTGANPAFSFTPAGQYAPAFRGGGGGSTVTMDVNFGQRPFAYTPPTGFNAINTYNIRRPADSSLWFYGDTPDLVWIKNRSTTSWHILTDTTRGQGLQLSTNSSNADSGGPGVTELNKFGMTILNEGTFLGNGAGNSHVYWAWKKGAAQAFDIVTYTGNGSSVSASHSLGVAPSFIITKCRNASQNWNVYHKSLGTSYYLRLNTTDYQVNYGGYINPTNSVVFYGGLSEINTNGNSYISYLFAEVPGYSAFGSYVGSGTADGPYVYTGFRPRYLLIKRIDGGIQSWWILDSTCDTYNVISKGLNTDQTSAESSGNAWADFTSNGFKIRTTSIGVNTSSGTYIYAAFAETPFKYARAR